MESLRDWFISRRVPGSKMHAGHHLPATAKTHRYGCLHYGVLSHSDQCLHCDACFSAVSGTPQCS